MLPLALYPPRLAVPRSISIGAQLGFAVLVVRVGGQVGGCLGLEVYTGEGK